ncbi:MAG: 23S rRNA (adenine(2503)-C(2))-methyltransferase RlmN, partial [Chloroflexia bacterium]
MAPANPTTHELHLNPSVTDARLNVYDLSRDRLVALMAELSEPAYRVNQVLHWLYKELVHTFDEMTNLPSSLRAKLSERLKIGSAELITQKVSSDSWTRKVLLKLRDGNTVEAVLMLYYDRATVCISSQVGCAMGCTFCATGQMGFTRNLSAGEIVEQVIRFNRWLREHPHKPEREHGIRYTGRPSSTSAYLPKSNTKEEQEDSWFAPHETQPATIAPITAITNIVFMGMGEPLVNYNHLWQAIRTINSPQGLGLGARRMTVSTVGIVPGIRRFAAEDLSINLAVSL